MFSSFRIAIIGFCALLFTSSPTFASYKIGGIELGVTNKVQLLKVLKSKGCKYQTFINKYNNEGFKITNNCFNIPFYRSISFVLGNDGWVENIILNLFSEAYTDSYDALNERYGKPGYSYERLHNWYFDDDQSLVSLDIMDNSASIHYHSFKKGEKSKEIERKGKEWLKNNL